MNVTMNSVASLTWDEVERRLANGAVAILPVGAGAKEHGWHLPMQTDQIQAEWLSARLAERFGALIWPTLAYGYYPAFVSYAGSCSLSSGVFEALVHELAAALIAYGPRLLVVNTGISTMVPIDRALARLDDPSRALHLKIHDGPNYRKAAVRLALQTHGSHADELETSRMLALAPQSVAMNRAAAGPKMPPGPGPMQHVDPDGPNYSRSGSIGDPAAATRDKGEALLAAMVQDMAEAVERWL
jgi:creatinine amidohydrolase